MVFQSFLSCRASCLLISGGGQSENSPCPLSVPDSMIFSFKKIQRLYVLHLLTMAATVVQIYLESHVIDIKRIIINVLLIQSWFPDMTIYFSLNGVAWYLSTAAFLYAMYPLVLYCIKRIKNLPMVIVCTYGIQMIVGIVAHCLFSGKVHGDVMVHWITYICPLFRLGDFIIGSCLGYWYLHHTKPQNVSEKKWTFIEATLLCGFIVIQYFWNINAGIWKYDFFRTDLCYTPIAAAFVLLAAWKCGKISKILCRKFMMYLGNISGPAFLIHTVIISYLRMVHIDEHPTLMFTLTFSITCMCVEAYKYYTKNGLI